MEEAPAVDDQRVRRERDLYLRLLRLGLQNDLGRLLSEALGLMVDVIGARLGYLEITGEGDDDARPRWSIAHGLTDDEIQAISRGIIAETLTSGETIVTNSALLDPRFAELGSVQRMHIEAVLCTPIGEAPPLGVLYLQGPAAAGPFSEDDRTTAEIFAHHLAPLADRLLLRGHQGADPTAPLRAKLRLEGIVGRSSALAALLAEVALVAPLDVNVLLTGESGTGKSQIARVIHDNGPRAARPFVELNCAAVPETLLESELFGAMPGAHSTATRRIDGKVAAAETGTLFLDEVGELTLTAQAKLLQLLQSRQYYPLGSVKPLTADVRVLAATNADLQTAVAERRFREDLFYRLQVLPLRVPSLAERRQDIPEIAAFFCADACTRHHLRRVELSRGALYAAEAAEWPGNVRQLAHAVEAATIRGAAAGATHVERTHLFPAARGAQLGGGPGGDEPPTFQEATRQFQMQLLRRVLEDTGWNVSEVARQMDLTRSHVYNLIRAFGLERADGASASGSPTTPR
jgi:Nif-specific regulatory protein